MTDGSLILWTKSENAAASTQTGAFGESNEDALYAREGYKIRRSIRYEFEPVVIARLLISKSE